MNQHLNEILKSLRERRGLSPEGLASLLKTTVAQIEILEKGDFKKIPKVNLERILEKYENFFKVELKNLLSEDYFLKEDKNIFKDNLRFKLINPYLYLLIGFLIFALIFGFFQLSKLILPPTIKILYPYDGLVTKQREIIIKGYVPKGITVLFLNNQEIIYDNNGYFQTIGVLKPGLNKFIFIAKNYLGLYKKLIINVYYQP